MLPIALIDADSKCCLQNAYKTAYKMLRYIYDVFLM